MADTNILRLRNVLVVSLRDDLHDELALALQEDIATRLEEENVRGVLLDVSTVTMIDTFIGRVLVSVGASAKLMGAVTVLVGMQPAVAMTLVELGMELEGLRTSLNVDHGFDLVQRAIGNEIG